MWIAIAVVTHAVTFTAVLAVVHKVRRRPFAIALVLSMASMVCLEAVVVNVLSLFEAVTREMIVLANLLVVGIVLGALGPLGIVQGIRRAPWTVRRLGWIAVALAPLAALILLSTLRYAPNSWDSMSYHLARVAHWIQHRSIATYPTNIARQDALQPGAEYLLLTLQLVSGTDRLSALVQFVAWIALALAAPAIARVAGAPRRVAQAAAPLVGAAPMFVLQASSTQNDLVAAVAAVAGIAATIPFLHRQARRWRLVDAVLLALALAAGAAVKLTASLAVLPVVVAAAYLSVWRLLKRRETVRHAARGIALLLALVSAIVLPELVRRTGDPRMPELIGRFTYPVFGDFPDRGLNVVRATFRHVPAPTTVRTAVGIPERCIQTGWDSSEAIGRNHEEYAGNALLVLVAFSGSVLGAFRWRRLERRQRLFLATTVAAWVLFQLTFRDNEWISRLEVPAFAVVPMVLSSLAGLAPWPARLGLAASVSIAVIAAASGTRTAVGNDLRPPLRGFPREVNGADSYYVELPRLRWAHDMALANAREMRCRRLGLALHEDSWDYPLTWRAMGTGIAVRHVLGEDPWPCLIYSETPRISPEAARWTRTPVPFLFLNAAEDRERLERP